MTILENVVIKYATDLTLKYQKNKNILKNSKYLESKHLSLPLNLSYRTQEYKNTRIT